MVKKKRPDEVITEAEPVAIEESTATDHLHMSLEEIKGYDGVIGYILRNSTSASIDLKDPTKIIDYAILSSSALDSGKELSELFDLGNITHTIVEGQNAKVLSLVLSQNKISVFMEKDADHERILQRLRRI